MWIPILQKCYSDTTVLMCTVSTAVPQCRTGIGIGSCWFIGCGRRHLDISCSLSPRGLRKIHLQPPRHTAAAVHLPSSTRAAADSSTKYQLFVALKAALCRLRLPTSRKKRLPASGWLDELEWPQVRAARAWQSWVGVKC